MSSRVTRSMSRVGKPVIKVATKVSTKTTKTVPSRTAPRKPRKLKTDTSNDDLEPTLISTTKISPPPLTVILPEAFLAKHQPVFIDAVRHILQQDPSLLPVFIHGKYPAFEKEEQPPSTDSFSHATAVYQKDAERGRLLLQQFFFQSLSRGLIAQQVLGAAARSIMAKVKALYHGKIQRDQRDQRDQNDQTNYNDTTFPPPHFFLETSAEELRGAGLSARKCEYVKEVAAQILNDPGLVDLLLTASDDAIVARLVLVRGIGEWSAQMFLLFALKRMDVFAVGDLGIARGIARYLEERPVMMESITREVTIDPKFRSKWVLKKQTTKRTWKGVHEQHMEEVAKRFRPYRSVLMLALWQLGSTNIDVLKGE